VGTGVGGVGGGWRGERGAAGWGGAVDTEYVDAFFDFNVVYSSSCDYSLIKTLKLHLNVFSDS